MDECLPVLQISQRLGVEDMSWDLVKQIPKKDAESICRGIVFKDFRAWSVRGGGCAEYEVGGYVFDKKGKTFTFRRDSAMAPQEILYAQIILDVRWYLEVGTKVGVYRIPLQPHNA